MQNFHRLRSKTMPKTKKLKTFKIGDMVYARFFGSDKLRIEDTAFARSGFPHYVCSVGGTSYLIPKIHLSTIPLSGKIELNNRKQLKLNFNYSNHD